LSEIFLSTWGIVSIVVAVVLFVAYVRYCRKKISDINEQIEQVLNVQDIVTALNESDLLKPFWMAFEKTLTTVGDKIYSTIDASEIFNQQSLTRGMNMTFWQNYGGIFTGLGILGTFAGLTFGLTGVDMTSDNIEVLKDGIKKLLSGVESAFVTSLVGIGCAIIYSVAHHLLMKKFQINVQRLAYKLDEKFTRHSVEDWLKDINGTVMNHFNVAQRQTETVKTIDDTIANHYAEARLQTELFKNIDSMTASNYTESQEQTTVLKNIGEQVAQAIHNALDEKLAEYVDNICKAIDSLGEGAAQGLNDTISKVAGAQMDRFSAALDKFSDKAETIMANAQEVSQIMNEQLLNTLKELDESLKQQAKASAAERDAASAEFLSTLKSLTNTLNEVAEKIKSQQEDSVKGFDELLKATFDNFNATMTQILESAQNKSDGMNQKFLETLESLTTNLNDLAEKIKIQQKENADGFAQMFKTSLDNFNAVVARILAKVQADTDKATGQNKVANEEFLSTLSGLSKTLQEVVDKFNEQQTGTLGNFESLVNKLLDDLDKFNRKQQEFLRNAANDNSSRISEAVNAFNDIVNRHNSTTKETFDKVQKILNETENYLELMDDASTTFKQAAEPVRQSTLQLTRNLNETSAQMNNLANANRITRENLSDLTAQLHTFVNNFKGIANELDHSTKIINDSLGNYNYRMSEGLRDALTKFDSNMGKALADFNELVDEFSDMVGYVKQRRR